MSASVEAGARVVSSDDLALLLGAERQRELLGCGDSSTACIAEVASALSANEIVSTSATLVSAGLSGDQWQLEVKRVDGKNGSRLGGGGSDAGGALDAGACDGGPELRITSERRYVWLTPLARQVRIDVVPNPVALPGVWVEEASGHMRLILGPGTASDAVICGIDPGLRRFIEWRDQACDAGVSDGGASDAGLSCAVTSHTMQEIEGDSINLARYQMGRPDAGSLLGALPTEMTATNLVGYVSGDQLQVAIPSVNLGYLDLVADGLITLAPGETTFDAGFDLGPYLQRRPGTDEDVYLTQLSAVDGGGFLINAARASNVRPARFDAGVLTLDFDLTRPSRLRTFTARFEWSHFAELLPATFDLAVSPIDGGFRASRQVPPVAFVDPVIGGAELGFYASLPDLIFTTFQDLDGTMARPADDAGFDLVVDFSNPYPSSSGIFAGGRFSYEGEFQLPDAGNDGGRQGRAQVTFAGDVVEAWDGGVVNLRPQVAPVLDVQLDGLPWSQSCSVTRGTCPITDKDLALAWTAPIAPASGGSWAGAPDSYDVVLSPLSKAGPAGFHRPVPSLAVTFTVYQPRLTVPRALLAPGLYAVRIISRREPHRSRQAPLLTTLPEAHQPLLVPLLFDVPVQ